MNVDERDRDQLVSGYLHDRTAWKKLGELIRTDAEAAWDVLLGLIRHLHPRELFLVGAGPLAELVAFEHDRLRDRIIAELRSNRAFLEAFRYVRVPEATEATRRELRTAMLVAGVPESELYDRP
jgi:hypothetical protein